MDKIIFIPLEVVKRELDSKIMLATEFASRGYTVVIGHKPKIINMALNSNFKYIFFDKSCNVATIEKVKAVGGIYCIQDEESGVASLKFSEFAKHRIGKILNLPNSDLYFTWSTAELEYLNEIFPSQNQKIINSGSPRTSLWGENGKYFYEKEIIDLKQKFGDYYLIILTAPIFSKIDITNKENYVEQSCEVVSLERIKQITNLLIKKYSKNIVIRPHPADDGKLIKKFFRMSKVYVMQNDQLTPLILASKMVLTDGSTGGVESALSNLPTVAMPRDQFLEKLSTRHVDAYEIFSLTPKTIYELFEIIDNLEKLWREFYERNTYSWSKMITSLDSTDSIKEIANRIDNLISKSIEAPENLKITYSDLKIKRGKFLNNIDFYFFDKIGKVKRPNIKNDYVKAKVEASKILLEINSASINVEKYTSSVFVIRNYL